MTLILWLISKRVGDECRVQGVKVSRIQVKGVEIKTLEPSNPGILEP